MKFFKFLKLFTLSAVLLAGCSTDDVYHYGENPYNYDNLSLPALEKGTFPENDLNLAVGESITFKPRVITPGETYLNWYFNGELVSTDEAFKYTATQQMQDGVLMLEMENDNGKVSLERKITVAGDGFAGKYLIINEGWFGHESGSVTAYDPVRNSVEQWALKLQNGGRELGVSAQSATMWNGKLYICSKDGAGLTVVDPATLKIEKQIPGKIYPSRQAYEFVGLNDQYGIVTANAYAYRVDLQTLDVQQLSFGDLWGGTGSGIVYEGNLLLNVKGKKINVIPVSELTGEAVPGYSYTPTTIDVTLGGGCRFVKAADGNLYTVESVSDGNFLVRIKPDLSIEKVAMSANYSPSNFGAYREASFCGTGNDNNFYYAASNKIYKCSFENPNPATHFCELPAQYAKDTYPRFQMYGTSVRVNPANGEIVAMYNQIGAGGSYEPANLLARFDGQSGSLIEALEYEGYWFQGTIIFNN